LLFDKGNEVIVRQLKALQGKKDGVTTKKPTKKLDDAQMKEVRVFFSSSLR
jgi:hypothetical protein